MTPPTLRPDGPLVVCPEGELRVSPEAYGKASEICP
jgi:hypothetical protein